MIWLHFLLVFVLLALVSFGIGVRMEADQKAKDDASRADLGQLANGGRLSEKLTAELKSIAQMAGSGAETARENRVPYGVCSTETACDKTTRCVQCASFEITEEDVPALRKLHAQEVALRQSAHDQGLKKEEEIHGAIIDSIEKHLAPYEQMLAVI